MKNVWIELHLSMSRPSPGGKRLVPISPFARSKNVRAIFARTPNISTVSNLFASERFWLRIAVYERRDSVHDENRERDALRISATRANAHGEKSATDAEHDLALRGDGRGHIVRSHEARTENRTS